MITVTCDGDFRSAVPVATEIFINGQHAEITGYLNRSGLSLGSIVQLTPGSILEKRVSSTPEIAFSSLSGDFLSATLGQVFQVHVEDDIRAMGHRAGLDFDSDVPKHTMLYIGNPRVLSVDHVVELLNRSRDLVEYLRTAATTHFAVVSGLVAGDDIGLFSTYESVAQSIIEIGSSYIHVSYSCSPIDELGHRANMAADLVPLIIYLTPIRYDGATGRIAFDGPTLNLSYRD